MMRSILLRFKSNTCGVLEKFSSLVWLNTPNNQLMFRLLGLFLENPFEAHRSKLPLHDCPIKKITDEQMQERRMKELCYFCEEKWQQGHHCVKPRLYLIDQMKVFSDVKIN